MQSSTFSTKKNNNVTLLLSLLFIFSLNLLLRLPNTSVFLTTDETPWLLRSANFYRAIVLKDWEYTNQDSNIGVIPMMVNSLSFYLNFPDYPSYAHEYLGEYEKFEIAFEEKGVQPLSILATSRQIMSILNSILVTGIAYMASLILEKKSVLFAVLLTSIDTYFVGISRLSHLDAVMSLFMFSSVFSLLIFLYKKPNRYLFLILSGVTGALSLLSKIFGLVCIPLIGIIFTLWIIRKWKSTEKKFSLFWKSLKHALIWLLVFIAIIMLLYPAMWIIPADVLQRVTSTFLNYSGEIIPQQETTQQASFDFTFYTRYIKVYIWRTSILLIAGLPLIAILTIKAARKKDSDEFTVLLSLILIALFLFIALTAVEKSANDYFIPVQFLISLFSAYAFAKLILEAFSKKKKPWLTTVILTSIILIQVITTATYAPYFVNYFNPILVKVYGTENYLIGMGEGLNEAAAYLNEKSNAENYYATSWYGTGPFSYYFEGATLTIPVGTSLTTITADDICQSDFLIVYENQRQRKMPEELFLLLEDLSPEHQIWIKGLHYVDIYEIDPALCDGVQNLAKP